MEVKPGYKQTEVGVIPEDWEVRATAELVQLTAPICYGVVQVGADVNGGVPIVAIKYVKEIATSPLHRTAASLEQPYTRSRVKGGDVLISIKGTIGRVGVVPAGFEGNISRELARLRLKPEYSAGYVAQQLDAKSTQSRITKFVVGTTRLEFSIATLRKFELPVPTLFEEQLTIAEALSDVDALLGGLDRLIAKKRDLKQAAMQQLLIGQTRLPGFKGEWELKEIADIASPKNERNATSQELPVLTCSKHFGFMDSLGFFKNQVFSKNLAGYKLIRRGEIGYPSNHVEEGSIGLQTLYDVALVSPIYVIFGVAENINSYFLHRLLKLDSYRQSFKTATSASVNRRGSLRWPAFSKITVRIPTLTEQNAIADVLTDIEAELATLEQRREKTRDLKQAVMQELLTGKTRLVSPKESHA